MTRTAQTAAAAVETAAVAAPAFGKVIFGRKMAANRLYPDNAIIHLNPEIKDDKGGVKLNPKRGAAAGRFAFYKDGMTVGAYIKAVTEAGQKAGVATADLKFDSAREFVKVVIPA